MGKTYKGIDKNNFLNTCIEYARNKGGKCLSIVYHSTHEKLIWQCEYGHIWEAMPSNVRRGKWCPICSRNKKLSIQDCIEYAKTKDGYCLSDQYINSATKLTWQCKYGHVWNANFNNIKSKSSWCPECSVNIGEKICRIFFEQFFTKPFPKSKPVWLKSKNGTLLELDGFNSELGIAFEYQGIQHYEIDGFFIKNKSQLNKRLYDDELKNKLCSANNIKLILVRYLDSFADLTMVIQYLTQLLNNHKLYSDKNIKIDLTKLYSNKIEKYKEIAIIRGGACLSDVYVDYYTKLTWQCNNGHIWDALGYSVEKGHWCPDCAHNKKGSLYLGCKNKIK